MSRFGDVRGQPAAVEVLRSAVAADEVAHAWLVVGPPGVGQVELARALTAALNCPDAAQGEGCGVCPTCERIARGRHPACADLEPEGANHLVDAVRERWIPQATRGLAEGRRRVLRVVAADRMNESAQNAFLKVLEEPPPSTLWLLEADDAAALLDTVVSRCRRVDVLPWDQASMRAEARDLGVEDPDHIEVVARAALGSPQRLRALIAPDVEAARRTHLALLDRLAEGGPGLALPVAKELTTWAKSRVAPVAEDNAAELTRLDEEFGGDRGWPAGLRTAVKKRHERRERQEERAALDHVLDDLSSYLRDLVVVQAGGGSDVLVNLDHELELARDVRRLDTGQLLEALDAVAHCRQALERNGNPQLQLERLLLVLAVSLFARR